MAWQNSTPGRIRRPDLTSREWFAQRRRTLRRDRNTCQTPTPTGGICGAPANQVDHIVPGAGAESSNLRAICAPCHRAKSSREGHEARRNIADKTTREHEPHPFHSWKRATRNDDDPQGESPLNTSS